MIINDIKVYILEKNLSSPMTISRGGFMKRQHLIVELTSESGIKGYGEAIGNIQLIKIIIDSYLKDKIIGKDIYETELIKDEFLEKPVYFERKGSLICALSAIEMACWDLKGKILDIPCYNLFGGLYKNEFEAYASDIYWEDNPDNMASNANRIIDKGFKALKIHIGCKPPEEEIKRIKAIRNTIGENIKLMVDLNAGYTYEEAIRACEIWSDYNLFWLEEPLRPDCYEAYRELKENTNILIAAGENEYLESGFKNLLNYNAIDFAMPDIGRVGGIKETLDICSLTTNTNVTVTPHNFASGILLGATGHLMAATKNTKFLEVDTSNNSIYEELLIDGLTITDGIYKINDRPGFGVSISNKILNKYGVK